MNYKYNHFLKRT